MACVGCSQVGDCACAVIGDGASIVVTGTGSSLDPYVVSFVGADFIADVPDADPDLCSTDTRVLAKLEDDSLAMIPAPKRCADPALMVPMCLTTDGTFQGWAIGSVDCDNTVALEYFDEDGASLGTTLPANWKPCVQGEDGPEWVPTHNTETYASSFDVDMATDEYKSIALTGDITFSASNISAAEEVKVRVVADSTSRAVAFDADWVFLGTKPTTIAANKSAVLTLIAWGATDASIIAKWEVQS